MAMLELLTGIRADVRRLKIELRELRALVEKQHAEREPAKPAPRTRRQAVAGDAPATDWIA